MDVNIFLVVCCFLLTGVIAVLSFFLFRRGKAIDVKQAEMQPDMPLTCGYENIPASKERPGQFFKDVAYLDENRRIWDQLLVVMEEKKLYLGPDIKIGDVAALLRTSDTHLSKIIKNKTGNNFRHFIHSYRVKEAMRLFSLNPTLTSNDLMSMVGFNSQTTFNSAYSRCTGYTPAEWCREYLRKHGDDGRRAKR